MTHLNQSKTVFPLDLTAENELRLSVKNGSVDDFRKSIFKFKFNCIDDIVNKVKVIWV